MSRAAGRYREQGRFSAWIYSMAARTARKAMRAQREGNAAVSRFSESNPGGGSMRPNGVEATVGARLEIAKLIDRLSEVQRQVLVLFAYHGMDGKGIAEVTGFKLGTVWSHLRRAR